MLCFHCSPYLAEVNRKFAACHLVEMFIYNVVHLFIVLYDLPLLFIDGVIVISQSNHIYDIVSYNVTKLYQNCTFAMY